MDAISVIAVGTMVFAVFKWLSIQGEKAGDEKKQRDAEERRRDEAHQADMEAKARQSAAMSPSEKSTDAKDEARDQGYTYIDVDDDRKLFYRDVLTQFELYAKTRGYTVTVHIDMSLKGKLGFKIVIEDVGVRPSTETVRRDVQDFVNEVLSGRDFTDVPAGTNLKENEHIIFALRAALRALKERYRKNDFFLESSIKPQIPHITVNPTFNYAGSSEANVSGDRTYNASNSPGAIQGEAGGNMTTNVSNFESTNSINDQLLAIEKLAAQARSSTLSDGEKDKIVGALTSLEHEVKKREGANKQSVWESISRIKTLTDIGVGGSKLIEAANDLFNLFPK